jgi:hypothetical protein
MCVNPYDVDANVEAGTILNGFSDNEQLTVFVFATDAARNAQQLTTSLAVEMGDDTPPAFRASFPAAADVGAGFFALLLALDQAATAHFWWGLADNARHFTGCRLP